MCFYAYILARETKLVIRWADITELSKSNSIVFPDSIRVVTRDNKEASKIQLDRGTFSATKRLNFTLQHYFSTFLHKSETYSLMEQLTNIAMKR